MLKVISEGLESFDPYSGSGNAEDTFSKVKEANKLQELEEALEARYPNGITKNALNKLLSDTPEEIFGWVDVIDFQGKSGDKFLAEVVESAYESLEDYIKTITDDEIHEEIDNAWDSKLRDRVIVGENIEMGKLEAVWDVKDELERAPNVKLAYSSMKVEPELAEYGYYYSGMVQVSYEDVLALVEGDIGPEVYALYSDNSDSCIRSATPGAIKEYHEQGQLFGVQKADLNGRSVQELLTEIRSASSLAEVGAEAKDAARELTADIPLSDRGGQAL